MPMWKHSARQGDAANATVRFRRSDLLVARLEDSELLHVWKAGVIPALCWRDCKTIKLKM
jgi:hypothetical protein